MGPVMQPKFILPQYLWLHETSLVLRHTISKSHPDKWHEHPLCQPGLKPTTEGPRQAWSGGCSLWHGSFHVDGKAR